MLENKLKYFIRNQQFVSLGTSTPKGKPHISPKIFLKYKNNYLYLIDFLVNKTCRNIKLNPFVSVSTFDIEKVKGYHIYGKGVIVEDGKEFNALLSEWDKRQNKMAARSISETVGKKKSIRSLKFSFLKPVKIYKIKVQEINFLNANGVLAVDKF